MQGISLLSILGQGTVTFLYTHSQDQKVHLFVLMVNFSGKELVMEVHMPPGVFLTAMFKLFFDYLDNFMIFYIDDVTVYSKTEQDHLTHLQSSK